jgi:hypothetical protein
VDLRATISALRELLRTASRAGLEGFGFLTDLLAGLDFGVEFGVVKPSRVQCGATHFWRKAMKPDID